MVADIHGIISVGIRYWHNYSPTAEYNNAGKAKAGFGCAGVNVLRRLKNNIRIKPKTISRYGYNQLMMFSQRLETNIDTSAPEPQLQKAEKRKQPPRLKWWLIFTALLEPYRGMVTINS
jgi:hypothetical protein